jgi:hypothetical protein
MSQTKSHSFRIYKAPPQPSRYAREVKEETGQVASPPVKRNIRATPVMESEPKEVA